MVGKSDEDFLLVDFVFILCFYLINGFKFYLEKNNREKCKCSNVMYLYCIVIMLMVIFFYFLLFNGIFFIGWIESRNWKVWWLIYIIYEEIFDVLSGI